MAPKIIAIAVLCKCLSAKIQYQVVAPLYDYRVCLDRITIRY